MRSTTVSRGPGVGLTLRRHALLGVLVAAYAALAFWMSHIHGVKVQGGTVDNLIWHFLTKVPQMIFFLLFFRLVQLTYVDRAPDRSAALKSEVLAFLRDTERLASGAIAVVIVSLMLVAFAQLKNLVPVLNPFTWDQYFMELDRTLHFGTLPHVFTLAVFGGDLAISFFAGVYNLWLLLVYFVLLYACFMRPDSAPRMQFLLSFLLVWALGGNLLATVFSSVGPVYYELLGLGDIYADLMSRLHEQSANGALSVVETQALLWQLYMREDSINVISAFPSMHVTSSVLMALFAYRQSRWAGNLFLLFALGILIGSVLLGWHYAVDGYAGILIAVLGWMVAGWLVRSTGLFAAKAR